MQTIRITCREARQTLRHFLCRPIPPRRVLNPIYTPVRTIQRTSRIQTQSVMRQLTPLAPPRIDTNARVIPGLMRMSHHRPFIQRVPLLDGPLIRT